MKSSNIFKFSLLCILILSGCTKGIKLRELVLKDKLYYKSDSKEPFSGKVYETYVSGKDSLIAELDKGLFNGDYLVFYESGAIKDSALYQKDTIIKFKRFLSSGLELKIPKRLLFQSKQGLTCILDENKKTIVFSGLSVDTFQDPSDPKGKVFTYEENYINGVLNGKNLGYHPNGKLLFSQNYRNGKLEGKENAYFDNGSIQSEGIYSNGLRTGKWTFYHNNKKIKSVGNFLNDRLDSTWNEYYENGRIKGIANYSNGKDNGVFVNYYENGNVKQRGSYRNGKRDGDWTWYYSSGGVESNAKYKDGNALSKCQCCGRYYNYDEGWTARNPGFSSGAWDVFADGGAGGGPYCSKGCARRCE